MLLEITIPQYLNPESITEIKAQLDRAEQEKKRFVILKGHEGSFCEGLDIKWIAGNDPQGFRDHILAFSDFLKKLQTGDFISVAIVCGAVRGGGMGVLCACDHVIVSRKSTFALPEGLMGLVPGVIFPALLNRMTPNQIRQMFLTGQGISSSVALHWGIVDEVLPEIGDLEEITRKTIDTMQSYKKGAVGDFKKFLYNAKFDKDKLAAAGADLLLAKLNDPEIKERLVGIAEFME